MIVWMLLIMYLFALRLVIGSLAKEKKKYFLTGAFVGIVFVMGSRYPAYPAPYADLESYYNLYERSIYSSIEDLQSESRADLGYVLLNKVMAMAVPWPQFILFAEAIICVGAVVYFVYKYSNDVFLSMMFYVTLGTMVFHLTGFRQSIAMSTCLFAVELARQKRLLWFIATVLLATTFHKTAVVFLPLYAVVGLRLTVLHFSLVGTCMVLGTIFAALLVPVANEMLEMEYSVEYIGNPIGGAVPIMVNIIAIALSTFFANRGRERTCLHMTIIGLIIYIFRYVALPFERVSFYFSVAVIVVLANGICSVRNRDISRVLYAFSVFCCIVLFLYRAAISDWGNYRFYW